MIKFVCKSQIISLQAATNMANEIAEELAEMTRKESISFLSSNIDGEKLAELMEKSDCVVEVHDYWYRSSRVLGMFDARYPDRVYINRNSLPRDLRHAQNMGSLVATLWHEAIHYLDSVTPNYFFHHEGNRFRSWKLHTAPYWIDRRAGLIVVDSLSGRVSDIPEGEAGNIVFYRPWWRRLIFWR